MCWAAQNKSAYMNTPLIDYLLMDWGPINLSNKVLGWISEQSLLQKWENDLSERMKTPI